MRLDATGGGARSRGGCPPFYSSPPRVAARAGRALWVGPAPPAPGGGATRAAVGQAPPWRRATRLPGPAGRRPPTAAHRHERDEGPDPDENRADRREEPTELGQQRPETGETERAGKRGREQHRVQALLEADPLALRRPHRVCRIRRRARK